MPSKLMIQNHRSSCIQFTSIYQIHSLLIEGFVFLFGHRYPFHIFLQVVDDADAI